MLGDVGRIFDAEPICNNWAKSAAPSSVLALLCFALLCSAWHRAFEKRKVIWQRDVRARNASVYVPLGAFSRCKRKRIFKHFIVNYYNKWINRSELFAILVLATTDNSKLVVRCCYLRFTLLLLLLLQSCLLSFFLCWAVNTTDLSTAFRLSKPLSSEIHWNKVSIGISHCKSRTHFGWHLCAKLQPKSKFFSSLY